jgi:hypothetical protein
MVDCMDCHNRPTHVIQPPDNAVNISLETGRLDRTLPYVKKIAMEALTTPYGSEEEASNRIESRIREFYQGLKPSLAETRKSSINQAVGEVRNIYLRNFFPRMNVDWRTYPDHIGHLIFDGCFRCHDAKHVSDDGRVIRKECGVCHEFQQPMSGMPEAFLTGTLEHPVKLEGSHADLKCSACHTGGRAPDRTCSGCHELQREFLLGKLPALPDVPATPSTMVEVDCDACHDLTKPGTIENLGARCDECHEKGYAGFIGTWKEEAADSRGKAVASLERLKKELGSAGNSRTSSGLIDLLKKMESAIAQIDKAGVVHNPEHADAIYRAVIDVKNR